MKQKDQVTTDRAERDSRQLHLHIHYDFKCQECGKVFKTTKAAERAVYNGCPKCGGVDIDLA